MPQQVAHGVVCVSYRVTKSVAFTDRLEKRAFDLAVSDTGPGTGLFNAKWPVTIYAVNTPGGGTAEWKSQALRAYQRRTLAADALIASSYLAGTNTRRVRRALAALFGGTVGKDTVSRTWRKVKDDWDS